MIRPMVREAASELPDTTLTLRIHAVDNGLIGTNPLAVTVTVTPTTVL